MMSSRGEAAPDAITSLLGVIGDPEGTKKRLEQIKAAQAASEEALAKVRTAEADLELRNQQNVKRTAELVKETATLDGREAAVEKREARIAGREAAVEAAKTALAVEKKAVADELVKGRAEIAKGKQETDAMLVRIETTGTALALREKLLAASEAKIAEARASAEALAEEYRGRIAALRALVN